MTFRASERSDDGACGILYATGAGVDITDASLPHFCGSCYLSGMTLTRRVPPLPSGLVQQPAPPESLRRLGQRCRMAFRVGALLALTVAMAIVQAVLILLPGRAKRLWARLYWAGVCRAIGLERHVVGHATHAPGRPVLFVSNHTSWLDIPALGGTLEACFVAKTEVAQWPVVSTIARLGRTVFVTRRSRETGRERDGMRERLALGDDLILFPEGTSSDGARVLSFRSPFFAVAEGQPGTKRPLIQPVSIVFDRLDGLAMWRATRSVAAWYGAMDLGSHFWRLAAYRRVRAHIVLHPPLDPEAFPSRKALAAATWAVVAGSAAALRQGRAPIVDTSLSLDRPPADIATVEPASPPRNCSESSSA